MAKEKRTLKWYEDKLTEMVSARNRARGSSADGDEKGGAGYLYPQVCVAASTWALLDKVRAELDGLPLLKLEVGSTGQNKQVVNPLVAVQMQAAKDFGKQLEALGLCMDSRDDADDEPDALDALFGRLE